ncbi:MAG TPA: serine/threonine-protein kinase [Thermodesulfobacteriota bacterium]|nr:serine/threonine-protein kinase [Thermodesulfobacteriota bacterium]
MDEMIGKTFGSYEIREKIGSGGMGRVYKAVHLTLNRVVAMKMIHPNLVSDQESINRFYKEAKIQAQLSHPNIVTVYDFLEVDSNYFLIMEYVHGESIGKIIAEYGYFEPHMALPIFIQILSGIRCAHSKGIIHRDVKPNNFILTPMVVKITDFGIAQIAGDMGLTMNVSVAGTSKYMSPEQILGDKTDHRTDIYSLGATFYEMLTGRVPFSSDANSDFEIKRGHVEILPTPLSQVRAGIPRKLDDIVLKALSKKPEDRFQSIDEFTAALENVRVRKRKATANKEDSSSPINTKAQGLDKPKESLENQTQEKLDKRTEKIFDEEGDLNATPYPTLLLSSYRRKRTGFLSLNARKKLKIYFIEGFVVFAEGEDPRLALGELLIDKSRITRMDREKALSFAHETRLKIGEALVKMGKITPHELNSTLETQIKERLIEGFEYKSGFYGFKDTSDFILEATYRIHPLQVIYDLVNRFVRNGEISDNSPYGMTSLLVPGSNMKEELVDIVFTSSRELKLLELVKERITLNEAISKSPLSKDDTLKFLYFLSLAKFVEIRPEKSEVVDKKQTEKEVTSSDTDKTVILNDGENKTKLLTEREIKMLRELGYLKEFRDKNLKLY